MTLHNTRMYNIDELKYSFHIPQAILQYIREHWKKNWTLNRRRDVLIRSSRLSCYQIIHVGASHKKTCLSLKFKIVETHYNRGYCIKYRSKEIKIIRSKLWYIVNRLLYYMYVVSNVKPVLNVNGLGVDMWQRPTC